MNQCRKPTLADRPWIQRIYEASGYRGAEYTFANLYLWSFYYGEVAEVEGYLCQRLNFRGVHQYLYPAGSGDIRPVLERIFADSRREGKPLVIRSLTRETMAQLEALYPGRFTYEPDRDAYDYLYEIGTLADLPGRKLQSKRNHINRFIENNPPWVYEEIPPASLPECLEMDQEWYRRSLQREGEVEERDLGDEGIALRSAMEHYEALGLEGGLIRVYGEVVAFTMGDKLHPNSDTYNVHFEKAFASMPGAYPMVCREFSRQIMADHPEIVYLNREDDMGQDNLREAKLEYAPELLLAKYTAVEARHA